MSYFYLRLASYQNEIKQLRQSVSQFALFLLLFMYLALPVFIFSAFMALGIIASSTLSNDMRVIYQVGFFVATFAVIRFQRKAIIADKLALLLNTYPASKLKILMATTAITLLGGNFFILAPWYLLTQIPDVATLLLRLDFLLFVLINSGFVVLALKGKTKALTSLVLYPIIAWLVLKTNIQPITSFWLNIFWLFALVVDFMSNRYARLSTTHFKLTTPQQLLIVWLKHLMANQLVRLFIIVLVIVLFNYVSAKLGKPLSNTVLMTVVLIQSLVLASVQFDLEKFSEKHRLYLLSLPAFAKTMVGHQTQVALLVFIPASLLIVASMAIAWVWFWPLFLTTCFGAYCVKIFAKNFFVLPLLFGLIAAMWLY